MAKLILVPLIILAISIAGRMWGPLVGGMLTGMPVVAGTITVFLALEQGHEFAIASGSATLIGIAALASSCFVYAWAAQKFNWLVSLAACWVSYFILIFLSSLLSLNPVLSLLMVTSLIIAELRLCPKFGKHSHKIPMTRIELVMRMVASAILVLVITGLADVLGPQFSGLFVTFPVAASVLAVFTHRLNSGEQAGLLMKGFMIGHLCLAVFYCSFVLLAGRFGFYAGFGFSMIVVAGVQVILYRLLTVAKRSGPATESASG